MNLAKFSFVYFTASLTDLINLLTNMNSKVRPYMTKDEFSTALFSYHDQ